MFEKHKYDKEGDVLCIVQQSTHKNVKNFHEVWYPTIGMKYFS